MNLRQLEVFNAIMQTGSVTAAARLLNISQPAVSAVLKHAEYQLELKLFERTPMGLKPTAEATTLFPHVSDVFSRIDSLRNFTRGLKDGKSGQIVIATTSTLLDIFIPRTLARLKQSSADIRVFIHMHPKPLVVDRVAQHYADIGLVYGAVSDARVEAEDLASTDFVCALPKGNPLCSKRYISPGDLKNESLILHGRYTTIGSLIDVTCRQKGVELPPVAIESSSCLTACLMVSAGAGVALVDSSVIDTMAQFKNVVFKPFRPTIKLKTQLIFPKAAPRSLAVQEFVKQLKKVGAQKLQKAQ